MNSSLSYFCNYKTEIKTKFKNNSQTNKIQMKNVSLML